MDPVKRRLVYIADENEALLSELSGTPPSRPSRMTRLLVPLSPPTSSQRSSNQLSPQPRPVVESSPASVLVDKELIVSYNGFLLADGSGHLATPRTAAEAATLRDALKDCRAYLRQFLDAQRDATSSTESLSTAASSSTYVEEDDSSADYTSDDWPTPPRRRPAKAAATQSSHPPGSPSRMTVAELREALRQRGVPAGGNKASLVQRVRSLLRADAATAAAPAAEATSGSRPPPETSPHSSSHASRRCSTASVASPASSPTSSQLVSPTSRASTEGRGLWGALVTAGSRLFGSTTRSSLGLVRRREAPVSDSPSVKRRRSV